jgi:hypothetical protein
MIPIFLLTIVLCTAGCKAKTVVCPTCEVCVQYDSEQPALLETDITQKNYEYIILDGRIRQIDMQSGNSNDLFNSTDPQIVGFYQDRIIIQDLTQSMVWIIADNLSELGSYQMVDLQTCELHDRYLILQNEDEYRVVDLLEIQETIFPNYYLAGEYLLDYIPEKSGILVETPITIYDLWGNYVRDFTVDNIVLNAITSSRYAFIFSRFEGTNLVIVDISSGTIVSDDIYFDSKVQSFDVLKENILQVTTAEGKYIVFVWEQGAFLIGPSEGKIEIK